MNKDYIYKRRLLKLADFLDDLPVERFYFGRWVGTRWGGKQDLSCGTTACGLGWATTISSLRKVGLRLKGIGDQGVPCLKEDKKPDHTSPFKAAEKIFGLEYGEYEFLFIPSEETWARCYDRCGLNKQATPKELAKHIRFFVEKRYE